MSGVVLLLAHMHSHQSHDFDAIGHERRKDLNALLSTITSMEKLFARDYNNPGSECASTLKRLSQAEQEMASGITHSITCFHGTACFSNELQHASVFDFELPYFGTVRVERLKSGFHEPQQIPNGLSLPNAEHFFDTLVPNDSTPYAPAFDPTYLDFDVSNALDATLDAA